VPYRLTIGSTGARPPRPRCENGTEGGGAHRSRMMAMAPLGPSLAEKRGVAERHRVRLRARLTRRKPEVEGPLRGARTTLAALSRNCALPQTAAPAPPAAAACQAAPPRGGSIQRIPVAARRFLRRHGACAPCVSAPRQRNRGGVLGVGRAPDGSGVVLRDGTPRTAHGHAGRGRGTAPGGVEA